MRNAVGMITMANKIPAFSSLLLLLLLPLVLPTVAGCVVEEEAPSEATSSAYREAPHDDHPAGALLAPIPSDADLHLMQTCSTEPTKLQGLQTWFPDYKVELDFRNPEHPRYRIRSYRYGKYGHERITRTSSKHRVFIKLRNGVEWDSGETLVDRPASVDVTSFNADDPQLLKMRMVEADARDPWDDLPIPRRFVERGLSIRQDGVRELYKWRARVDFLPLNTLDCSGQFYGGSDWTYENGPLYY